MSDDIGNRLPDDLFNILRNEDVTLEQGRAILVNTIDGNGWPHSALLSYREVFAFDQTNILMVTYADSTTTRNMRANGKVTLNFVDERMSYYVKGSARENPAAPDGFAGMYVSVVSVLRDFTESDEAGAYITTGMRFYNPWRGPRSTLES